MVTLYLESRHVVELLQAEVTTALVPYRYAALNRPFPRHFLPLRQPKPSRSLPGISK